jgi:hypothetical protein
MSSTFFLQGRRVPDVMITRKVWQAVVKDTHPHMFCFLYVSSRSVPVLIYAIYNLGELYTLFLFGMAISE